MQNEDDIPPDQQFDEQTEHSVQPVAPDSATLAAITGAEIDRQIETAKRFPRSLSRFRKELLDMATLDEATAEECLYALPRKDAKTGKVKNIEGPSARFAELVASAWGNARIGARIVEEQKSFIVAQGAMHDLERNVAISFEVRRRITGKSGRRYGDDMIGVTAAAASSIALRNAVLKVVPKAYWAPAWEQARLTAMGKAETLAKRRDIALNFYKQLGVDETRVCAALGVKGVEDIGLDQVAVLRAWKTSLKDGETTPEALFPIGPELDAKAAPQGGKKATDQPPGTQVEETNAVRPPAEQRKQDPPPPAADAPAGKRQRRAAAPEPAADAQGEQVLPEDPPGGKGIDGDGAKPKAADPMPPLDEGTMLCLPHNDDSEPELGALAVKCSNDGVGQAKRWDGQHWLVLTGDALERAVVYAATAIQKRATQHVKRAGMDKAAAMSWVQEQCALKTAPSSFTQLPLAQLLVLAEAMDS